MKPPLRKNELDALREKQDKPRLSRLRYQLAQAKVAKKLRAQKREASR